MNHLELEECIGVIVRALELRKKYMRVSLQNKGWKKYMPNSAINVSKIDGLYTLENDQVKIPGIEEFYADIEYISRLVQNGPLKTFCFHRLEQLELQFKMHKNMNSAQEKEEQKTASRKDFYTVVKADTHIHHSASMNSKKLLQFIKRKLRECPNEIVHRSNKEYTLQEIFQQINKTADTLCFDSLDTHSNIDTFHRFDRFNSKYNPYGLPLLREIFLKHDNYNGGKFLAEITKELLREIEDNAYLMCEWGISVYGKKKNELEILCNWIDTHNIKSSHLRWYIQVPRLYALFKGYRNIGSFSELLDNLFESIVTTSVSGGSPQVESFLETVGGFDSVDDESVKDKRTDLEKAPPHKWTHKDNPPYQYYIYYMYYYVALINRVRASRGKNIFSLRPHSGECGDTDHLISAFLTAKNIAHGVKLRKSPVLQYLFYLSQIGISMSPISNNSLFIEYKKNPFPQFFYRGLNVSLSTDDPLQFHYTREPLMEEYSVASQIWKLSSCDQCEIAKNSVLISTFSKEQKEQWIGEYDNNGVLSNDTSQTNVPPTRFNYRKERIKEEYQLLNQYTYSNPRE
ncbi:AMP deaminase [Nematocida sp. AWRm80]|nr:AMP deaminase [Nematocida sp. AWRm80]